MVNLTHYRAKMRYIKNGILSRLPFYKIPFYFFEQNINPSTVNNQHKLIQWAKDMCDNKIHNGDINEDIDIKKIKAKYFNYFENKKLVFFIQLPTAAESPGVFSLFGNLIETLQYMGIQAFPFHRFTDLKNLFTYNTPNVILAASDRLFIKDWLWDDLHILKKKHSFSIGLTASIDDDGVNNPLTKRLILAKKNGVDFYFSWVNKAFIDYREGFQPYRDFNYQIFSMPLGANLLKFQPISLNLEKDLDYVFLGSFNHMQYIKYFSNIFRDSSGFIGGMGWNRFGWVDNHLHSWLYARAKVGLNINGIGQRQWASEVTERTYILAAAGVPQITDNTPLLQTIFGPNEVFVAGSPKEYDALYRYILKNPDLASNYAKKAKERILSNHTTFHRAENLVNDILYKLKPVSVSL